MLMRTNCGFADDDVVVDSYQVASSLLELREEGDFDFSGRVKIVPGPLTGL